MQVKSKQNEQRGKRFSFEKRFFEEIGIPCRKLVISQDKGVAKTRFAEKLEKLLRLQLKFEILHVAYSFG